MLHPNTTNPAGATVADLIPRLNLPEKLVRNAFINNQTAALTTSLQDGDRVNLFPPVVGGCSGRFATVLRRGAASAIIPITRP